MVLSYNQMKTLKTRKKLRLKLQKKIGCKSSW